MVRAKEGQVQLGRRALGLALAAVAFIGITLLPVELPQEQLNVLAIVAVAAILWFSEALPLFVTSLLVPVLLALATQIPSKQLYEPFFDPVVALFFASFVLAEALSKQGLDERVAGFIFRRFGRNPRTLLLGLMFTVAIVGMWLSNTATVAFMLPVFMFFIRSNSLERRAPRLTKSLLLGLAFATAFDGLATIIGTPPNAIAVRYLADIGTHVNFFDWMLFGVPAMLLLIPIAWLAITAVFPPEIKKLKPFTLKAKPWTVAQKRTIGILLLVVALWTTQSLHGIDTTTVGFIGVVLVFVSGLLAPSDLGRISWPTLILFGGGLVLGEAMVSTGVTDVLAEWISGVLGTQSPSIMLLGFMLVAVVLTSFGSNTAVAALLIPVVISFAQETGAPAAPLVIGVTLALSVDVLSPVGTPPNAMVHGTGLLRVSDFLRAGLITAALGIVALFIVVSLLVG